MGNKDVIAVLEQRVHELEYHAYHRLPEFGLDQLIWFDDMGCMRNTKHNDPRIKYGPDPDHMVPISIEIPPRVLVVEIDRRELRKILHGKEKRTLFKFIDNNYDLLMDHWN